MREADPALTGIVHIRQQRLAETVTNLQHERDTVVLKYHGARGTQQTLRGTFYSLGLLAERAK